VFQGAGVDAHHSACMHAGPEDPDTSQTALSSFDVNTVPGDKRFLEQVCRASKGCYADRTWYGTGTSVLDTAGTANMSHSIKVTN